jgi:hypothetical protein
MLSGYPLLAQTHTNHQDANHQAQAALPDSGLEITVVDNQGKACAGAIVELADLSNQPIAKAIAGNDGVARLTGLSPDRYTLTVRCPGFAPVQTRVILREQATFKLDVSHEAPLIETTQATVTTTGGAVVLEAPPLIDTRASQVMSTFSNTVLTTGGAIITENRPVGPPRKRGFFRRALDKMFHPHK